jgi:hypothetical protein
MDEAAAWPGAVSSAGTVHRLAYQRVFGRRCFFHNLIYNRDRVGFCRRFSYRLDR